jgi:hypothetical protein
MSRKTGSDFEPTHKLDLQFKPPSLTGYEKYSRQSQMKTKGLFQTDVASIIMHSGDF